MPHVLVTWIGKTDLKASEADVPGEEGPIARALELRTFDRVRIVADCSKSEMARYLRWLRSRSAVPADTEFVTLSSPMSFREIYPVAVRACERALQDGGNDAALTLHLSPGSPAMAAVWIILAKTRFPAELIQSSKEHGVETASVPFDISADFIPDLLRERDEHLRALAAAEPPEAPEFSAILHGTGSPMAKVVQKARRLAVRNVPILIQGETGTGKELCARAIHGASPRRAGPFVPLNCGAIPETLIESELFGHERGAFTGAHRQRRGCFESADRGTLFLDEVGELPRPSQVKLLRVLQDNVVTRLGGATPIRVDLRVVAATNRDLAAEIRDGRFREDLYYRLAVGVVVLPPLRDRGSDISLLVDRLWASVNHEAGDQPGFAQKKLSVGGRNLLLRHAWPGNVRELKNTLIRLALDAGGPTVVADDVREALHAGTKSRPEQILGKSLGAGFDLNELLKEVAGNYLARAMAEARGNKTAAARLLGLRSYQTLKNWLRRYAVSA